MIVEISHIVVENRVREDMGDIAALASSIKEFGIIQPIVLDEHDKRLIAGGRRLAAVQRLGWTELVHGRDFIWRMEMLDGGERSLRNRAVELEENLRRKGLTWQEEVKGKQDLLTIMQGIYGEARMGAPTRSERLMGTPSGFGVNKLSAMLGESNTQTSNDLALANIVKQFPSLAKAETKESARRQYSILGAVASMMTGAKAKGPAVTSTVSKWTLYEGDFRDNISQVADKTADLIYTDLPFGVSLSAMSKHATSVVHYADDRKAIVGSLEAIAQQSYRVLNEDRYAVFFFGFNYYPELVNALQSAGFGVNLVPVVWYKHTRSTENPNTRYANAYDPAIIAMKGSPVFIRPGNTNVVDIPAVAPSQKLQIAQQPVELVKRFIEDMTTQDALVLDLCAGSGTTGEAAIRTKRRVVLFEHEPSACALIRARLGAL